MVDDTYKKLYESQKKFVDEMLNHHCPKKCKYCREWYREVLKKTKKVKNKKMRETLENMWKTLWLNNEMNWDVIDHCFEV